MSQGRAPVGHKVYSLGTLRAILESAEKILKGPTPVGTEKWNAQLNHLAEIAAYKVPDSTSDMTVTERALTTQLIAHANYRMGAVYHVNWRHIEHLEKAISYFDKALDLSLKKMVDPNLSPGNRQDSFELVLKIANLNLADFSDVGAVQLKKIHDTVAKAAYRAGLVFLDDTHGLTGDSIMKLEAQFSRLAGGIDSGRRYLLQAVDFGHVGAAQYLYRKYKEEQKKGHEGAWALRGEDKAKIKGLIHMPLVSTRALGTVHEGDELASTRRLGSSAAVAVVRHVEPVHTPVQQREAVSFWGRWCFKTNTVDEAAHGAGHTAAPSVTIENPLNLTRGYS
jgi:hypothetical protein